MSRASREAFDRRVDHALRDGTLQEVIREGQDYMQDLVQQAHRELDWPALLEQVEAVRSHTVAHLDFYVDQFATNVEKHGGVVFFAATAQEARDYVLGLALKKHAKLIVKAKSMVSEEVGLNRVLEAAGVQVVETDLGELIVQLAHERPFHIVAPAIHKTLRQIRDLFVAVAGQDLPADAGALTGFARRFLREKFFAADIGISGCNFGVAATGSVVLVTNEGNGRMTTTLPKTHVVLMGMERLVPDFESLEPILTVLPWVGAGTRMTSYVTAISGPKRSADVDGPEELHVVIVDNGRSGILGSKYQKILNCIRCGACLDVCPVYRKIGGHAYDAVYCGPIGAVLSPLLAGRARHSELPFASSLCGACSEVCAARIPLADYLLELRCDAVHGGLDKGSWRLGFRGFSEVARRPRLWAAAERLAGLALRPLTSDGAIRRAPSLLGRWTHSRDLPAVARHSFRELWRRQVTGARDGRKERGTRRFS
jgi:L-lactate dehydrogenase complex protein LldF